MTSMNMVQVLFKEIWYMRKFYSKLLSTYEQNNTIILSKILLKFTSCGFIYFDFLCRLFSHNVFIIIYIYIYIYIYISRFSILINNKNLRLGLTI
jgi:hypothetical protein